FPFLCPGKIFAYTVIQRIITMEEKEMTQNTETTDTMSGMDINTDENAAGTSHLNEPVSEESVLDKLESEVKEQKDKYLRLMAEFDNFRRRTAKERLELMQTAGKEVIVSLLDVLDDCDRAEKQLQGSDDITLQKEGIQLVFNKLRSTLQAKGVKPMESINSDFDVEKHEAITEIPAPTPALQGKVIDEVVKGYYLNDKLIRFAKVVVGK
ncbi:MAG: nucleotide exchange factor GrpE, partial [Sediminibacterium sp.]